MTRVEIMKAMREEFGNFSNEINVDILGQEKIVMYTLKGEGFSYQFCSSSRNEEVTTDMLLNRIHFEIATFIGKAQEKPVTQFTQNLSSAITQKEKNTIVANRESEVKGSVKVSQEQEESRKLKEEQDKKAKELDEAIKKEEKLKEIREQKAKAEAEAKLKEEKMKEEQVKETPKVPSPKEEPKEKVAKVVESIDFDAIIEQEDQAQRDFQAKKDAERKAKLQEPKVIKEVEKTQQQIKPQIDIVKQGLITQEQLDYLQEITKKLDLNIPGKFELVLANWTEWSGYESIKTKSDLIKSGINTIGKFITFMKETVEDGFQEPTVEDLEKLGL